MFKKLIATSILILVPFASHGAMITTTFANNNNFSGNMFDLTTFSGALDIRSFEVHVGNFASVDIEVFTRVGGYSGFEANSGAWTNRGTTTVTGQGEGNATLVDLVDFSLQAITTYGVYVRMTDQTRPMYYTNGSNTYANADLQLDLGIGCGNTNFCGNSFDSRTWNGTINYDVSAVPIPATAWLFGTGLIGLIGFSKRRKAA